ncbi:MAG: hypothetical protein Kow0031_29890 [Anaerolineae bacterium]
MSNNLPEQWQTFLENLQLPPGPVQAAFEYSLTQLLVEAGEMDAIETIPPRPDISPAQEEMVFNHLRWLLGREL